MNTAILASLNDTALARVCPLCDSDLTTLVQDHLHNCVVAFQAALLVHLTQDGRVLGRSHVGGHQPGNVRCVQTHVGAPGKGSSEDPGPAKRRRTRQQKAEIWQGQWQEQRQIQGQGTQVPPVQQVPGRLSGPDHGASAADLSGAQTRPAIEINARRQFIRLCPGTTSTRDVAEPNSRNHAVETGLQEQEGHSKLAQPIVVPCMSFFLDVPRGFKPGH